MFSVKLSSCSCSTLGFISLITIATCLLLAICSLCINTPRFPLSITSLLYLFLLVGSVFPWVLFLVEFWVWFLAVPAVTPPFIYYINKDCVSSVSKSSIYRRLFSPPALTKNRDNQFIQSQPPFVRNYLRQWWMNSLLLLTRSQQWLQFQVKHSYCEQTKEYSIYKCSRHTGVLGKNAPGIDYNPCSSLYSCTICNHVNIRILCYRQKR